MVPPHDQGIVAQVNAVPLAELSTEARHPVTGETFAAIAARLDPTGIIRRDDIVIT